MSGLQVRTHQALLDLYALDTRLQTAHVQLVALDAQGTRLRGQQDLLKQELSATRRTLNVSQSQLGTNLRLLYEQGDVSALAVVLGAQNLDEGMTKLDALSSVANETQQVVLTTSAAQLRLTRLSDSLRQRRSAIDEDIRAARQTTDALGATRASRVAFVSRLRRTEKLKSAQIRALQAAAARVERKSNEIQASTPLMTDPIPPASPVAETTPPMPAPGGRTLVVSSTGYSLPGHTATGIPVGWGVIAVDPSLIPLGTRLTVPGYGEGVAADTGGAVLGADIDLWFPTLAQARAWGRRTVTITLH